jgi:hypothetical protein
MDLAGTGAARLTIRFGALLMRFLAMLIQETLLNDASRQVFFGTYA